MELMELMVRARLQYVVERWRLLDHAQAGYRPCRSTEEQLVLTTQTIADALQAGDFALMLPVDFTAAFDRASGLRVGAPAGRLGRHGTQYPSPPAI